MDTSTFADPQALALAILDAVKNGQYRIAAALGLVGVVFGVRWVAPKVHGRLGAWLNSDRGGAALSLIIGVLGSIITSMVAGKPLSFALVLSGVVMAATGSGIFNLGKKIAKPDDKPPGQAVATPDAPHPAAPKSVDVVIPLLLLVAGFASACTAAQVLAWKTFGVDAGKCVTGNLVNAVGDAMVDLMASLQQADGLASVDPAALGKALAEKYGTDVAVCALGKVAADLLPAAGLHAAPTNRTKLIKGMLDTQKSWAAK